MVDLAFELIPLFWSATFQGQREKGSLTVSNSTWKIGTPSNLLITSAFGFSYKKNEFRAMSAISVNLFY